MKVNEFLRHMKAGKCNVSDDENQYWYKIKDIKGEKYE